MFCRHAPMTSLKEVWLAAGSQAELRGRPLALQFAFGTRFVRGSSSPVRLTRVSRALAHQRFIGSRCSPIPADLCGDAGRDAARRRRPGHDCPGGPHQTGKCAFCSSIRFTTIVLDTRSKCARWSPTVRLAAGWPARQCLPSSGTGRALLCGSCATKRTSRSLGLWIWVTDGSGPTNGVR